MDGVAELTWVSLEPSPVIDAYKKDVDRTLIRENLKLIAALRFMEEIRASRKVPG
jgi:hypothetical protein